MAKSVRVHDDTHTALQDLKVKQRSASLDAVIREMIRATTGSPVGELRQDRKEAELTEYLEG